MVKKFWASLALLSVDVIIIMVLFVFVIMLLNTGQETGENKSLIARNLGAPLIVQSRTTRLRVYDPPIIRPG